MKHTCLNIFFKIWVPRLSLAVTCYRIILVWAPRSQSLSGSLMVLCTQFVGVETLGMFLDWARVFFCNFEDIPK